ncbi:family 16 glycosylhydrolase [uncultured Lutibacter sp.]|uniref:glycoside hydrolase family 16 protein n=1 Tax=uncultured Lutibacter sp. TaxID=437739 RepID=UPI00263A1CEF|nr:family 16 glycosylhydrolase [uncultured Lutibacter sp.]
MNHYKTDPKGIVLIVDKLAFWSGYIANQLFPAVLGVFMLLILQSCSNDNDDKKEAIQPSNLTVNSEIIGTSTEKPNGDGTGVVNFTINATNASSYKVLINGETKDLTSNTFSYTFKSIGTINYTIIVSAYNLDDFISTTITLTVFVGQEEIEGLLWSDEFNNNSLDLTKWNIETGTGVNGDWGTGQLDRATERPENIRFDNSIANADGGCLVITTRKESYIDRDYTSGRINTANNASWGPGHRIVARVYAKGVKHQGQGFAFWMMPQEKPANLDFIMWPQGGEIDVMEYVGAIPFNNLGTVHYAWEWQNNEYQDWNHGHLGGYYNYETEQTPNPSEPEYGNYPPADEDKTAGSAEFHEYGIDWYSDRIEFFIDENVYHIHYFNDGDIYNLDGQDEISVKTIDGRRVNTSEYSNHFDEWHPFEHKMNAILSGGVGGSEYTYGGAIVPEAEFPCDVYIDWVRVYAL